MSVQVGKGDIPPSQILVAMLSYAFIAMGKANMSESTEPWSSRRGEYTLLHRRSDWAGLHHARRQVSQPATLQRQAIRTIPHRGIPASSKDDIW
jgi:hypothetical protein